MATVDVKGLIPCSASTHTTPDSSCIHRSGITVLISKLHAHIALVGLRTLCGSVHNTLRYKQ